MTNLTDESCELIHNCKCFTDTAIERQIVKRVLTAMQSLYLHLWGEKGSRPYMQSFHFAFSVGALLAPVVGKLFISSGKFCGGDILQSGILSLGDR